MDYRSLAHKKKGVRNGMASGVRKKISNVAYRRVKTSHTQDNLPFSSKRNTVSALQAVSPRPKSRYQHCSYHHNYCNSKKWAIHQHISEEKSRHCILVQEVWAISPSFFCVNK